MRKHRERLEMFSAWEWQGDFYKEAEFACGT